MRRLLVLGALAAALALGACSSPGTVTVPPAPQSARQAVYAAEIAYESVLAVAVRYSSLPRCIAGQTIGCSDAGVVIALRSAHRDVSAALHAAIDLAATASGSDSRMQQALAAVATAVTAMRQILLNHQIS